MSYAFLFYLVQHYFLSAVSILQLGYFLLGQASKLGDVDY